MLKEIFLTVQIMHYRLRITEKLIIFFSTIQMGNICCDAQQRGHASKHLIRTKRALPELQLKRNYELQISRVINDALFKHSQKYTVNKLELVSLLGKGGQAQVFLIDVHSTIENKLEGTYAMKRISKKKLDSQRTREAIMLEKQIMISYSYPFITQVQFAFQDKNYLYLLMKLAKGGDVFSLIMDKKKSHMFDELGQYAIKFILAGCILGLKYLHSNHIIYRDLKPENLLIFQDGYPKIADFGVAEKNQQQLCFQIKGTILYLAPQMFLKSGYNHCIDLWALGVLAYEMIFKQPPFTADLIKSSVFHKCVKNRHQKPLWPLREASIEAKDFIRRLLVPDPLERLGARNITEIMSHAFFNDFDWQSYQKKALPSPLKNLVDKHPMHTESGINIDEIIPDGESIRLSNTLPYTYVQNQKNLYSQSSLEDQQQTCCPQ